MSFINNENFWLAVCFIIFLYLVYKPFKKILLKLLDTKIENIKTAIKEAEGLKHQAETLLLQTKQEISKLDELTKQLLDDTTKQTDELIKKRSEEARAALHYKKSQIIASIQDKQEEAGKALTANFKSLTAKVIEEYFNATDNENLSDLEIATLLDVTHKSSHSPNERGLKQKKT